MPISEHQTVIVNDSLRYRVEFSEFPPEQCSTSIPVVNIEIVAHGKVKRYNEKHILYRFAHIIFDFLQNNDVVLFYICDDKELLRAEYHKGLSPQAYRHRLFKTLSLRKPKDDFIRKDYELNDPKYGDHFVTLLTKPHLQSELEVAWVDFVASF